MWREGQDACLHPRNRYVQAATSAISLTVVVRPLAMCCRHTLTLWMVEVKTIDSATG